MALEYRTWRYPKSLKEARFLMKRAAREKEAAKETAEKTEKAAKPKKSKAPSRRVLPTAGKGKSKNRTKCTKAARRKIYVRDCGACVYCNKALTLAEATLDHVIPYSKGGRNAASNLVLSCMPCNQAKADFWDVNQPPARGERREG